MSDLAGPIRDNCLILGEIFGRIADSYKIKLGSDLENANNIM